MNQLTSTTLSSSTINNSYLTDCTHTSAILAGPLYIDPDTQIHIGDYHTTGEELVKKIELLDKLIAKYYPEYLI